MASLLGKNKMIFLFSADYFALAANLFLYAVLVALSFSRQDFFLEHLENFSQNQLLILSLAFLFLLVIYLFLFFSKKINNKLLKIIIVLILFLGLICPPFLSRDLASYSLGAKLFYSSGQNPYLNNLSVQADFAQQLGDLWWLNQPFVYGPVFLAVGFVPWLIGSANLLLSVYAFKILALIFFILSFWIFRKIRIAERLSPRVDWLYLFNPVLLINVVFEGHNDIFLVFFILAFLYWQRKPLQSGLSLLAAVFIKYSAFIFWPLAWFKSGRFKIKYFLLANLASGVALLLFLWFSGLSPDSFVRNLLFFIDNRCLYECSPVIKLLALLPDKLGPIIKIILFLGAYFFIAIRFLLRKYEPLKFIFWAGLALFLIPTQWLTPWYFCLIIPFGLLIKGRLYAIATFLATAYSLFHYLGAI